MFKKFILTLKILVLFQSLSAGSQTGLTQIRPIPAPTPSKNAPKSSLEFRCNMRLSCSDLSAKFCSPNSPLRPRKT